MLHFHVQLMMKFNQQPFLFKLLRPGINWEGCQNATIYNYFHKSEG